MKKANSSSDDRIPYQATKSAPVLPQDGGGGGGGGGGKSSSFRKRTEHERMLSNYYALKNPVKLPEKLTPSASDIRLAAALNGSTQAPRRQLGIRRTSSASELDGILKKKLTFDPNEYRTTLHPASTHHTPLASLNTSKANSRAPSTLSVAFEISEEGEDRMSSQPITPVADFEDDGPPYKDTRTFREKFVDRTKRSCTKKLLFKRLPILEWLPKYDRSMAISDLIAGITVGLTILPQAIAFSNIAGIPPQYGLYSSFVGCFMYTLLGSSKDSSVGPSSIQAIITRENALNPDFAVLLCFFAGVVELLMGILQMGFIIDFISGPVSMGFTSAAAIIIGTTQVKNLLGINIEGGQFVDIWTQIFEHISETRLWDAVLGFCTIITLFLLKNLQGISIGPKAVSEKTTWQKIATHTLWLLSVARNIVIVVVCSVIALVFYNHGYEPFKLTGYVKPGLPTFEPPPFTTQVGNQTYSFTEMTSSLSSGTFVMAILAVVENIATAKVFANGKTIDATQEMLAIGISNILSSFVGSMPITGAMSRGAVNNASGVRTTFGGIYTGILVLVSLAYLTPFFFFIPNASLAAVIIMAVVTMVEYQVIAPMWKAKRIDVLPALVTFLSCLFIRLEVGIFIGIGINVLFLLYSSARPKVEIENANSISGFEYLLLTPDRSLVFPSVEYVKAQVSKAGLKHGFSWIPVVVDCTHIQGIDFTAAKGIKSLMDDYSNRKQMIIFFNLKRDIVGSFKAVKPKDFVLCYNLTDLDDLLREHTSMKHSHLSLGEVLSMHKISESSAENN